uniref:Uncharacterized protein n=1 Tax=Xiphophorus couchianus TaxID=32473 RepID=A0A3B5L4U4_9TELE
MYQELLLSSALLFLHVMGTPQFFGHHGRRACSGDLRHNVILATESYAQPVHKPYITLCQGHRLCSTYKTTYSLAYRQVSRIASASHFYPDCCPGWRRFHSHNCNQALCAEPCANGGTCLKPNKCACPPGWTGHRCQTDADECGGRQPCAQLCVNTAGSYRCACRDGFTLAGDGRVTFELNPAHSEITNFGLAENVTEEVQSLRNRVELLEKVDEDLQIYIQLCNCFKHCGKSPSFLVKDKSFTQHSQKDDTFKCI